MSGNKLIESLDSQFKDIKDASDINEVFNSPKSVIPRISVDGGEITCSKETDYLNYEHKDSNFANLLRTIEKQFSPNNPMKVLYILGRPFLCSMPYMHKRLTVLVVPYILYMIKVLKNFGMKAELRGPLGVTFAVPEDKRQLFHVIVKGLEESKFDLGDSKDASDKSGTETPPPT